MKLSRAHFRSRLLRIILDKKLSVYTDNEIMSLFGDLTEEEKEITAKALIPKVENCETGEQILSTVKTAIQETKRRRQT